MSKSRKDSDDVRNSTAHKVARVNSPGKVTNTVFLAFRAISERSKIKRCSNNKQAFSEFFLFPLKKTKSENFPRK